MIVTKHGVATVFNGREVEKHWYPTKQDADRRIGGGTEDYYHKYIGTKKVVLFCSGCDKDLEPGDKYIKTDEDTRYCEDCYEENSITYYTVGGEPIGDENEIEAYDDFDLEAEREDK